MRHQLPLRSPEPEPRTHREVECARCDVPMRYMGEKQFHEGRRYGLLGDIGELFVNKERFDVYACPRCGVVEFFVDGVGEHLRPH